MANIILVDDHKLILDSFPMMIEKMTEHKVIKTFSNPQEALRFIVHNESEVDLLITDMKMKEMNGVRFVQKLKDEIPDLKVMVMSQYDWKEFIIQALEVGILGYILKNIDANEFVYAIEKVLKGELYLCNRSMRVYINAQKEKELHIDLTIRERETLLQIALGKTSKQIAVLLDIEVPTVSFHRKNIMQKIGAENVADMTRRAFEIGLVEIGEEPISTNR